MRFIEIEMVMSSDRVAVGTPPLALEYEVNIAENWELDADSWVIGYIPVEESRSVWIDVLATDLCSLVAGMSCDSAMGGWIVQPVGLPDGTLGFEVVIELGAGAVAIR